MVCWGRTAAQSRDRGLHVCWKRANTVTWQPGLAAQVIKAYVDKKNRQGVKVAGESPKSVEIGAVWSMPDASLQGGRLQLDLSKTRVPLAAAAPGLQ